MTMGEPSDQSSHDSGEPFDPRAFAEKFWAEADPGAPPAKRIPLPKHWEQLLSDMVCAAALHHHHPEHPLHKLDRFDVVALRGDGGYGLVFEVYDPKLRRNVALKLCQALDHQSADDILAEARTLAKLNHPNVITVHETGQWGDDVFFVMDLVRGKTAYDFAEREDRSWQEVVDIYLGAGAGLAAAHDTGIIHADFKPTNVLVEPDGSWPRVADFGLSRVRIEHARDDEIEEIRVRVGTLGFAAPETLRGLAGTELSDQWSFCASMWHTLEGSRPFVAESSSEMLEVIEHFEPLVLSARVPEQLRDVLRRGLAREPEQRFPDMRALLRALAAVRRAEPEPRPGVDEIELLIRGPEPRKRNRTGWGLAAVMTMIAAGALLAAAGPWRTSDNAASRVGVRTLVLAAQPQPSASPCALTRAEAEHAIHPIAKGVCELVRLGNIGEAKTKWDAEYDARWENPDNDKAALATDSLILARTMVSEAESLLFAGRHDEAQTAQLSAGSWAARAASTLGEEHAGVRLVELRRKLVKALNQPKQSTTPLPSTLP